MLSLPRPARFQIHLSTALLLMVVAGCWMWLNTIPSAGRVYMTLDSEEATILIGMNAEPYFKNYGWPMAFIERFVHPLYPEYNSVQVLSGSALAFDLAVGLVAVGIAYFVGERWARKSRSNDPLNTNP